MKMFAVSYINWYDHKLITEFIHATDWREALIHYSKCSDDPDFIKNLPQDKEAAKQYFFDGDSMFESVEVPGT